MRLIRASFKGRKMAVSRQKQARATPEQETKASDEESYFGGKGGCFRWLINQIPPHKTLIIPFAGHCAVARNIRPPKTIRLYDLDSAVIRWWHRHFQTPTEPVPSAEWVERPVKIVQRCGLQLLEDFAADVRTDPDNHGLQTCFIYMDPPYLQSTLKSESRYRYQMNHDDHCRLLAIAKELPCRIMISGYWSKLYAKELSSWRHFDFPSQTHGGKAIEHVWCNYPEPTELHDYRYLGRDRRERFKLLRRANNLIGKLKKLSPLERNALLDSLHSAFHQTRQYERISGFEMPTVKPK